MGKKRRERSLADNEAKSFAKTLRVSPQKLNLVAKCIRGKNVETALAELTFSKRRIARDVKKVVASAIANAENNHQLDIDGLYVKEVTVGPAIRMKRWRARARGRASRIQKPLSNLTVVLREREETV